MNAMTPPILSGFAGASRAAAPYAALFLIVLWIVAELRKRIVTKPSPSLAPACPSCNSPMVVRIAKKGPNRGTHFWGCSRWPDCHATLEIASE